MSFFNISKDDLIYASLLLVSIPFGHLVRQQTNAKHKQWLSSGFGACLVFAVCRWHCLHSLLTATVNAAIILFVNPRFSHIISFIWCFGYIVFFRTTHYLGLPKVPSHANAIQLLLTLKLSGMAFEVRDSFVNKQEILKQNISDVEKKNIQLKIKYHNIKPSFVDMMLYSYCYVGILTGPYYKFRVYWDMIHTNSANLNIWKPMIHRLKMVPPVAFGFLILSQYFNTLYVTTEGFLEYNLLYRIFYMVPIFAIFRFRLYFAWIMSEAVCINSALGAYPKSSRPKCGQGPTDLEALDRQDCSQKDKDFETVHNVDMYGCDFATTVREGMRSWNMSVQYWLASNIYRRFPNKSMRTTVTMLVSAWWHGIHPGYYLSFLLIPPVVAAEDAMRNAFRSPSDTRQQYYYDWINWFFKMRALDYMAMGFLLLRFDYTWNYWKCIYFTIHVLTAMFLILGYIYKPKSKR